MIDTNKEITINIERVDKVCMMAVQIGQVKQRFHFVPVSEERAHLGHIERTTIRGQATEYPVEFQPTAAETRQKDSAAAVLLQGVFREHFPTVMRDHEDMMTAAAVTLERLAREVKDMEQQLEGAISITQHNYEAAILAAQQYVSLKTFIENLANEFEAGDSVRKRILSFLENPARFEHPLPAGMKKPTSGILAGEPVIIGQQCKDGGKCHHACKTECFRQDGCAPLECSGLTPKWNVPGSPEAEKERIQADMVKALTEFGNTITSIINKGN